MNQILAHLPDVLPEWYEQNKRDLPWRRDRNPYHVWLSEIMLQQTRVEAVKGYYTRFLAELPNIESLSKCEDDRLHKLWEGLGYYTRVRNLKKAAQVIMDTHHGTFPAEYDAILALPGIGAYTAGAISSIAFGHPRAAVDGNVLRVVSRLTDRADPVDLPAVKKKVQAELEEIYPKHNAGAFTQSLMELGATICLPNGQPKCSSCPCQNFCTGQNNWKNLPVRLPKRSKKQENLTVFIFSCEDRLAIEKRPDTGLLAGLWQFPNCKGTLSPEEAIHYAENLGLHPTDLRLQVDRHHIFTHIRWDMRGYYIRVKNQSGELNWLTLKEIDRQAALPTAFRQFREEIENV